MNKNKNVAQILIEVLQQAGVKNCYGIIGDTLNFVGKAIEKAILTGSTPVMRKQPLLPPVPKP